MAVLALMLALRAITSGTNIAISISMTNTINTRLGIGTTTCTAISPSIRSG